MSFPIKSVAVYCGSNIGNHPVYRNAVKQLSNIIAEKKLTLVYGGAKVGLMGLLADHVLNANGQVIGVIPQSLVDIEKAHNKLTSLHVVNSMHERKKLISELADGFILMPGGAGSLDEFFEIFTWQQLGQIKKPCGILNVNNYFKSLIDFLDHAVNEGFLKSTNRNTIIIDENPEILFHAFEAYVPINEGKWI